MQILEFKEALGPPYFHEKSPLVKGQKSFAAPSWGVGWGGVDVFGRKYGKGKWEWGSSKLADPSWGH